jgi:hypothetical protein
VMNVRHLSITSSACASSVGGTSRPSAPPPAVVRLASSERSLLALYHASLAYQTLRPIDESASTDNRLSESCWRRFLSATAVGWSRGTGLRCLQSLRKHGGRYAPVLGTIAIKMRANVGITSRLQNGESNIPPTITHANDC